MYTHLFWTSLAALALLACFAAPLPAGKDALPDFDQLPVQKEMPDPLVMQSGKRVADKEQWVKERRPELKKLFQHYMYGYAPPAPTEVKYTVERVDPQALGGKATLKEVTIWLASPDGPKIHVLLVVPNQRKGPAPVFVGMNFAGNHAVLDDPKIRLSTAWIYPNRKGVKNNHATEESRGSEVDVWAIEQTIDRGYAVATFYSGDVDPDRPDVREGVQKFFGPKQPGEHDWGTIMAWAWGIQRVIDYLVTDRDLDPQRIVVVGHSRLGKTALLAGAFDERIAVIIPHQAGMGGSAPSRGTVGESVKKINTAFPHWFNGTYKRFNDQPEKLPFDQNALVALCAPRPVLFSNAVEDTWANPNGQFQVLVAADPVYRFLGVEGLSVKEPPPLGKLVDSRLGYWVRAGTHSMNRADWHIFVDFADRHLSKTGKLPTNP
jgi:cephalosporin-C deacetylase-like acetyl esterase